MIKTFTQDDLIRFLYHETTEEETREINKALLSDFELRQAYRDLCETKSALDRAQLEPSEETVMKILAAARAGR
jgi:hypothetical protein